jgi:uracil-DNA glycosylase
MTAETRIKSLNQLASAEQDCTRCPLYKNATQAVAGEGRRGASLMLVGEQPGDKEDLAGKPFVGPAGRLLDAALKEAGIDRTSVFVTNAVKHFKHEMRGKRRLHKRPNTYEIERCKFWLETELKLVRPETVVALGATAARSLLSKTVSIAAARRQKLQLSDGTPVRVTGHPSALLRIKDEAEKRKGFQALVSDLRRALKPEP